MLQQTQGIVLRSIKYGEASLITTIFTNNFGVQSYIIKGVRSQKSKQNKTAFLQPASLIDLVVYHNPNQNLQYLREYQATYIYQQVQEQVIINSVALFSIEFLLRILPQQAPIPEMFAFCQQYFIQLDQSNVNEIANLPIYFIANCSKMLGYEIKGNYTEETPHLNIQEGGFSAQLPASEPLVNQVTAKQLSEVLIINSFQELHKVELNSQTRLQLLEWYLAFLHHYCQHLGEIKSLRVLQTILH